MIAMTKSMMKTMTKTMSIKMVLLASVLTLSSGLVSAHSSHSHAAITLDQAYQVAADISSQFTQQDAGLDFGVLPESWASIDLSQIKLHKQGEGYYIIAVSNDKEGKILFILMDTQGKVYDANFSGSYEGL